MSAARKEALYQCARDAYALGESLLKSFSGADQADSEAYFCARRVYVAVAGEIDLEVAIAAEDKRWRAYAAEQAVKVAAAPKIKRGPSQGHSVISHRWVDPEKFTTQAHHIRQMIRIIDARQAVST